MIGKFFSTVAATAALLVGVATAPSPAKAQTITIGLQQAGVNGGVITPFGSSLTSQSYGDYTVSVSAAGGNPGNLNGQTLNVATGNGNVPLFVYITLSGLTAPAGTLSFTTAGSASQLNRFTFDGSTFLNANNAVFGTSTQLGSFSLSGIGSAGPIASSQATPNGTYSVTERFVFTPAGNGSKSANVTISLTAEARAVPGPVMGAGLPLLLGFGAFLYYRRRQAFAA